MKDVECDLDAARDLYENARKDLHDALRAQRRISQELKKDVYLLRNNPYVKEEIKRLELTDMNAEILKRESSAIIRTLEEILDADMVEQWRESLIRLEA